MLTDDEAPVTKQEDTNDTSPDNVTVRLDKVVEVVKKTDAEDPKPRIVLTFRSEKTGAKSSNMKIVSAEEKHEEISPRRSIRTRNTKKEFDDDNIGHVDSDDDEPIESIMTHKRPTRHRYKFSDVIAKAIARKENIYNAIAPRSYHKIKPTTKKPANEDSRVEMESKNKARLGKSSDKSAEEHVRKRRCVQSRNYEAVAEKSSSKRKIHEESATESSDRESDTSNKKLMHMGTLGLKIAKDEESNETENRKTESSANEGGEEEEIDDDTEVISKLLQADEESASDEDFCPETSKRKRANRNCSPAPLRRSTRKPNLHSFFFRTYQSDTGDSASEAEDTEAKCPTNSSKTIVTCLCEESSNVHAAPSELTEPVFCQAVETVEGVRVGCSHGAARDADGALHPLRRAALRTPYFLACKLHSAQLTKHMCCPTCGLFCTEGIFYQCSKGHLFHLECGIVGDPKQKAGCPHCGVWYRWEPANVDYVRVRVQMHCSNKRVFLPDQREQCTPAFLGFSSLDPALLDQEPTFPKELLPVIQNVKELMECTNNTEGNHHYSVQNIYDAIMANESIEEIVSKIVRCENVNEAVSPECGGGSVAQAAAARGRLDVLVALRARAACLDAADSAARTPLITAMLALLDRDHPEETELEGELPVPIEAELPVKKEEENEQNEDDKSAANTSKEKDESDTKDEVLARENTDRPGNDDLVKVIQYLIAVGCDVDKKGPEGLCALHMAAEHGGLEQTLALLAAGARVDARNDDGWTPLVMAAENKHAAIVRILLAAGADPEACDVAGNQPVHWSAQVDADRTLALLLHAAPHAINALNVHTETPLHTAARQGHYACVVLLLEHGAKTDIENKDGLLPIELSSGPCHDAISTHMQMTLVVRDTMLRTRIISSDISNGREPFPVSVVNEVDDATLDDFTYVSQHVRTEHIPIDDSIETMQGCTCADGDCGAECSCCVLSVRRWTRGGRLPPDFPHHDPPVLFECNHTCACNPKRCANRLVGRMEGAGSLAVRVQVFRTARRGWGLRAAARAGRGALLALYRGELLPGDRADARTDDQYMFALDLKPDLLEQCGDKTVLCVDASRYGSAARFMNHSCRPTAAPVRVFTDARDLRLPHVAFFALVDIAPGDELTFDYGDKFWSVKSKWMKCECEAPDCRYPTENTDEEES